MKHVKYDRLERQITDPETGELKMISALDAYGHENPDPTPMAIPITLRPVDMKERIESYVHRSRLIANMFDSYDADDDDDFDVERHDGDLPDHTPNTEGFVDSMAPSRESMIKTAVKTGMVRLRRKESAPSPAKPATELSPPPTTKSGGGWRLLISQCSPPLKHGGGGRLSNLAVLYLVMYCAR